MRLNLWACGAFAFVVTGGLVGCSGSDQSPLGGPYGGSAEPPPPTVDNTQSQAANGSTNGGSSGTANGNTSPSGSSTGDSSGGGTSGDGNVTGTSGTSSGGPTGGSSGTVGGTSGSSGSSGSVGASGSSGSSGRFGSGSGSGGSGVSTGSSGSTPTTGSSGSTPTTGSSGGAGSSAPTWTTIYTTYLASGTIGNCNIFCHSQMSSASSAYSWLKAQGYMSGSPPKLTTQGSSCLTWYGGNMPQGGPRSNAQAVTDMNAWAAAGAQNN